MKVKILFLVGTVLAFALASVFLSVRVQDSCIDRCATSDEVKQQTSGFDESAVLHAIGASEAYVKRQADGKFMMVDRANQLRAWISSESYQLEDRTDKDNWRLVMGIPTISKGETGRPLLGGEVSNEINKRMLRLNTEEGSMEFINEDDGFRHNYIVEKPPRGQENLQLTVPISGNLIAQRASPRELHFFMEGSSGPFSNILIQDELKVWDANKNELNAWFEIKENNGQAIAIVVEDRGAKYPIVIDPLSTSANRSLIGSQASADYGYSVSTAGDINGDGYSDVIIGAPDFDNGQYNEGAAFVHYGSINGIGATADLMLEVNQVQASFGTSVATAGDVNGDGYSDVIVGARIWESGAAEQSEGAAFIYHGSAAGLNPVPVTQLEPNHAGDVFGSYVNSAGDVNGDGYSDVLIGAYLSEYPTYQEGSVFVHLGSATGINPAPSHHLQGNQSGAHFGISAACAGDVNGDGYSDIIVGASRYDVGGTNNGASFIWFGSASSIGGYYPPPDQTLSPITETNGNYGWSVSSAGDVNGDGYSDVVIGAYRADNGQTDEGMAFVHLGSAGGVNTVPQASLEFNQAQSWFGRSVSNLGDVNGDGYSDIGVGATRFDYGQTDEGAIFVFAGSATGIDPAGLTLLQVNTPGANLGNHIRGAGDVNGDGFSDVIGGANIYGSGGGAFIFHGGGYSISATHATDLPSATLGEEKGKSVAHAGDVNGDGFADAIVGIPNYSNGQANEGAAEVYYGSITGIGTVPDLVLEPNQASALFGTSVSTAGDVNGDGYADIIVGAPGYSNGQPNEGGAYIYMGSPGGLSSVPTLILQSNQANAAFGRAVSKAGDINSDGYSDVVVGAPDFNGVNDGVAMLFLGSAAGVVNAPNPVFTSPQANSGFGISVNTAGDVNGDGYSDVIIGAPLYDNGQVNEGAGFVYYGDVGGMLTTPSITIERDYAGAELGTSVSTAGDANGDGFWDIIMGAPKWSNNGGTPNEGAAFVWYGTAAGVTPASPAAIQRNQANAEMGTVVSDAGDLNGDGYADIVVGIPFWDYGGQVDEGAIYVYLGSRFGILAGGSRVEGNVDNAFFGTSAQTAGDVNGDGYSDIIVGAPEYNAMGTARIFHGNADGNIFRYTRQYQADLVNPLAVNSMDYANPDYFGIGHHARSFTLRQDVTIEWEVVHEGEAFSGVPITNSVSSTGNTVVPVDLGLNGVEIKQQIYKLPPYIRHKWRVRVKYDPVRMIDGQPYSRWFYGFAAGFGDIGVLPVELTSFVGHHQNGDNHLHWVTASEINNHHFNVQRSSDGTEFVTIAEIAGAGNSQSDISYELIDRNVPPGTLYYRLEQTNNDGTTTLSEVISITSAGSESDLVIYPNPVDDILNVRFNAAVPGKYMLRISDARGQELTTQSLSVQSGSMTTQIGVTAYPSGTYLLQLFLKGEQLAATKFIKR